MVRMEEKPPTEAIGSTMHGGQEAKTEILAQVFRTGPEGETIALGEEPSRRAVVLLVGELGAGRTTLAKGIVKGLGATEPEDVSSPSPTFIHGYGAGSKVYHIDLYHLEEAREAATLAIEQLLEREAAVPKGSCRGRWIKRRIGG